MNAHDPVNSPSHYDLGDGREVVDSIEDLFGCSGHLPQAWAYVLRSRRKGHEAEDLRKARWYVRRVIAAGRRPPAGFAMSSQEVVDDCRAAGVRVEAMAALLAIGDAVLSRVDDRFFSTLRIADGQLTAAIEMAAIDKDGAKS